MVLLWCSTKPKWWVRVTVRIEAELLKREWFAVEAVTLAWLAIEAVINSVRVVQITIEGLLSVKIPVITTGFMGKWMVQVPAISLSSKRGSIKPKAPMLLCVLAWAWIRPNSKRVKDWVGPYLGHARCTCWLVGQPTMVFKTRVFFSGFAVKIMWVWVFVSSGHGEP